MSELPDNVDLQWIGRHLIGLQRDVDMLIRLTTRLDTTVNALREDMQTFWLNQRDLRERIETVERR